MHERHPGQAANPTPIGLSAMLREEQARRTAGIALHLGGTAMQFAAIERVPRYHPERRENNAEHSFMLALVATELAHGLYPDLDTGLVCQFSMIHDLVELETGDIPTFEISAEALEAKKHAEEKAVQRLVRKLPPYTAQLLMRYEKQEEREARHVRMVDKYLPLIVDILGPGQQVMAEDYGVYDLAELVSSHAEMRERFLKMCPEFPELHEARNVLASQFETMFAEMPYTD